MRDCVVVTRFWGRYPLDVVVAEVAPTFRVGPFRGQGRTASFLLLPETGEVRDDGVVILQFAGPEASAPFLVPPGRAVWASRGPETYRIARDAAVARVGKWTPPEASVVGAGAFAAVVAAAALAWAAMSVPALGRLGELALGGETTSNSPVLPAERRARWATFVGSAPVFGFFLDDVREGGPTLLPDCRDGPLPACPGEMQAFGVAEVLREATSPVATRVIVDARLEATDGELRLAPLRQHAGTAREAGLELRWQYGSCGEYAVGQRVLVEGEVVELGTVDAGPGAVPRPVFAMLPTGMCAVVPGTEPSGG